MIPAEIQQANMGHVISTGNRLLFILAHVIHLHPYNVIV